MGRENRIFIQGRPSAHPIHLTYGKAMAHVECFEDQYVRWHDNPHASKGRRYFSWIVNGLYFLFRKEKILFTECVRIPAFLARILSWKHKKVVSLMADETLYFLYTNRYPFVTAKVVSWYLRQVNALICLGDFQYNLALKYTSGSKTKVYKLYNGLTEKRHLELSACVPDLQSKKLLFISHGPGSWRTWYKGLDLMLEAFSIAKERIPGLTFEVVGEWDIQEIELLLAKLTSDKKTSVIFHGKSDIFKHLKNSFVYIHCARGDAFPTAVLESMSAGLIPIITDVMGTQELVRELSPELIVCAVPTAIADQIEEVLSWDDNKKREKSKCSREIAHQYSQEKALTQLNEIFDSLNSELEN